MKLIKGLKENLKNSKKQENNIKKTRICDKCGEIKPLDVQHFQVVKYFRDGFSYYCHDCSKPKPKD